jgi:hypothetical protein
VTRAPALAVAALATFVLVSVVAAHHINLPISSTASVTQRGATPRRLSSTFASGTYDPSWEAVCGEWVGANFRLVLLPRAADSQGPSLYGAIPDGPLEGALDLRGTLAGDAVMKGTLVRARESLPMTPVTLVRTASGLRLDVDRERSIELRRSRNVNRDLLARVPIIAHRGLSLNVDSLMNSSRAIDHARRFGASGVELDVTVPYEQERSGPRIPRPRELRISHPPVLRSELTGFDSDPVEKLKRALTPRDALNAVSRRDLPLVYLDLKLRWLIPDHDADLQTAIDEIERAALDAVRHDARLHVFIGAETGRAAEILDSHSLTSREPRLGWAAELTKGTDIDAFLTHARSPAGAPSALSLNLLRIRDGGGGMLGWFLRDADASFEARVRQVPQPLILWTAASSKQFEGALLAIRRMSGPGQLRSAAIITPFPHRLAWFLATVGEPPR